MHTVVLAAVAIAVSSAACERPAQPVSAPTTTTPVTTSAPAPPPPPVVSIAPGPAPDAPGGDGPDEAGLSTGVKECDDYLAALFACVKDPKMRAAIKPAIAQMIQAWGQASSNPNGQAAVASACKSAMTSIPQASCH